MKIRGRSAVVAVVSRTAGYELRSIFQWQFLLFAAFRIFFFLLVERYRRVARIARVTGGDLCVSDNRGSLWLICSGSDAQLYAFCDKIQLNQHFQTIQVSGLNTTSVEIVP